MDFGKTLQAVAQQAERSTQFNVDEAQQLGGSAPAFNLPARANQRRGLIQREVAQAQARNNPFAPPAIAQQAQATAARIAAEFNQRAAQAADQNPAAAAAAAAAAARPTPKANANAAK